VVRPDRRKNRSAPGWAHRTYVSATDAVTFAAVNGLLLALAVAANVLPALRAMSVDPVTAMRNDEA
jgi:hypothetical protein